MDIITAIIISHRIVGNIIEREAIVNMIVETWREWRQDEGMGEVVSRWKVEGIVSIGKAMVGH